MRIILVTVFVTAMGMIDATSQATASLHGAETLELFSADVSGGQIAGANISGDHSADGESGTMGAMESMPMAGMMRPDMAPPAGIMGGMSPSKGNFMGRVSYMRMLMGGNRDGTTEVSAADVRADFMVSPLNMKMDMLMASGMYGVSDDLSLMGMIPYIRMEMDHTNRAAVDFTTRSEGIGDVRVTAAYNIYEDGMSMIQLFAGMSLPTGSTNKRDDTPAGLDQVLPYPMQLGSGTVDALPGILYSSRSADWSWGARAGATLRIGRNSKDYSLGDAFDTSLWGARRWGGSLSTSIRLNAETIGDIDGADSRLNASMVPTADPDLRAGTVVSLGLGANYLVTEGSMSGVRFALEGQIPVYQNLDGPQLQRDFSLLFSAQRAF